jgi:hypothetical protein
MLLIVASSFDGQANPSIQQKSEPLQTAGQIAESALFSQSLGPLYTT